MGRCHRQDNIPWYTHLQPMLLHTGASPLPRLAKKMCSLKKKCYKWEIGTTQKAMSNPQVFGCQCFKYNRWVMVMTDVLPMPNRMAVRPPLVHAIQASKHPRSSSCFIHHHQSLCVLFIWELAVIWTKNPDQYLRNNHTNLSVVSCPMRRTYLYNRSGCHVISLSLQMLSFDMH
jgi:hypothetical protein